MKILIRADSSAVIGTGHVMRCIALAQALQDAGATPVFVMAASSSLADRVASERIAVLRHDALPGSLQDAELVLRWARKQHAQWVVLDGYHFDAQYQRHLRQSGLRVLCVDDYSHLDAYDADLLLNQNLLADGATMYSGKTGSARLLLGPEFVLLRREFMRLREWRRTVRVRATNVLITLGGADALNMTCKVLEALARIPNALSVRVVVGSANQHVPLVERAAQMSPHDVTLLHGIRDMPQHMQWADIAVCAAGSTVWEILFLQLPVIVGVLAENQFGIAQVLGQRGLAVNVGWYTACGPMELTNHVQELLSSHAVRTRLARDGRALVDGQGAQRVAELMR